MKNIPAVHKILSVISDLLPIGNQYLTFLCRKHINKIRGAYIDDFKSLSTENMISLIKDNILEEISLSFKNIINGTGIVLNTNLGRAPFNAKELISVSKKLEGYVNLEYNLISGKRSNRMDYISDHISSICGSESSLVVNNNAAAILLAINTIAEGYEVICSRGQLVEIGGSFRISDMIKKSGATLVEVGSTNRTHVYDYENAITKNSRLLLWVHTSNYRIEGYTNEVSLKEMVQIGKNNNLIVMADLGSGTFINFNEFGLPKELPIKHVINQGLDLTTFSGDKLIGGPQSGIITGSNNLIKKIHINPIYRTMRIDKITLALIDQTISGLDKQFFENNLTFNLLTSKRSKLKNDIKMIYNNIPEKLKEKLGISIFKSKVAAGSGSLPIKSIKSMAIKFDPKVCNVDSLAKYFRINPPHIIGYINNNIFYIDFKAILPKQYKLVEKSILSFSI